MQSDELRTKAAKLTEWVRTKLPSAEDVAVSNLERPSVSGYGHVHYFFDLSWWENGQRNLERLVLREEPAVQLLAVYDLKAQFHTMKCLGHSNVPVPNVYWFEEDKSVLGGAFLVMGRVEGRILNPQFAAGQPSGLLHEAAPEERGRMWRQGVEMLARIHTLDWERLGLCFLGVPGGGTDAIDRQIALLKKLRDRAGIEHDPLVNAVFEWIERHKFAPTRISLCWGDARLGNMLYANGEIAAVLDWDLVHLGDPVADLAGFVLMEPEAQTREQRTPWAGIPSVEETVRYYESVTGRSVEHLSYWNILRLLRPTLIAWRLAKINPAVSLDESHSRNLLIRIAQRIGVA